MPDTGLVPLLRRTYWISFVAIAAVALSVITVAAVQHDRDRRSEHSRELVAIARQAQILALDRETGVRGFLLTGDSSSLAPDLAARAPLRLLLDSLIRGSRDNPTQRQRAEAFARAIARWDSTYARPAIAQRAARGPGAETILFGAGGLAGKILFDDVRLRFAEYNGEEERLYRERSRVANWLQATNVVITLGGLVALGLVMATLRRRTTALAAGLVDRQTMLEDQATVLEEQAAELEQQATELQAQTAELQDTVHELARKNEELNAFSASVAHDLRTPLRSIDGFSHVLLEDYAGRLDDSGVSALKRIRTNAQRMGDLIDGLLSLARVSGAPIRLAELDLSELATATAEDLLRGQRPERRVELVIQPGLVVRGDGRLLTVVLHNLLSNALKFTRETPQPRIEVGASEIDGVHTFFVRDNGIGFDMRYAGKLFMAFERLHDDTSYEGTGIGLATVRRIIERHGGRIWAESEPGHGATFAFTLSPNATRLA